MAAAAAVVFVAMQKGKEGAKGECQKHGITLSGTRWLCDEWRM
jgi:hypothetical protein